MTKIIACLLASTAISAWSQEERCIAVDTYCDKMAAGWLGQIAGVCWGAPTEFKWNDEIIPMAEMPHWSPEMINQAFEQDDLYVEMTFLRTLEKYGLDASIRQAGIDFANSEYKLWCANDAGRKNLRRGIAPPASSHPRYNSRGNDIDYQIEADFAGLISPGLPNSVIRLGETFGRLMNYGDGVYGGQFMGALYAEAFFTTNMQQIIAAGLAAIPEKSQYAEMVRDLVRWHQENPHDWQDAWRLCLKKYRRDAVYQKASNGGIDVRINGAAVLLGLLYGQGDLDQTIIIACRAGWDSDCNPSSAAGVLFTTRGRSQLPARFTEKLDTQKKFSYTAYAFPNLLNVCERLARQIVVQQGGRIDMRAGKPCFIIPVQRPKPSAHVLTWAPGPCGDERFTPEEYAQIRFKPHPADISDPDPTTRVQAALTQLFRDPMGNATWTTSPNGPDMNPGYREDYLGRKDVLVTHPLNPQTGVTLTKTFTVPMGTACLNTTLANSRGGDFRFRAKINGKEVISCKIGDQNTPGARWQTIPIALHEYGGQKITVELINQPDGWKNEAAYWGAIEIK